MNPDQGEQSAGRLNKEAWERINRALEEVNRKLDQSIKEINRSELSAEEKEQKRRQIEEEIRSRMLEDLKKYEETLKEAPKEGEAGERQKQQKKEAKDKLKIDLFEASQAAKKGINVAKDDKAQRILQSLGDRLITEEEAGDIMVKFGRYLLGDKPIVFSSGAQKSDIEKDIEIAKESSPTAVNKFIDTLVENAAYFGKEREDIEQRLSKVKESPQSQQQETHNKLEKLDGKTESLFINLSSEDRIFFTNFLSNADFFIEYSKQTIDDVKNKKSDKFTHEIKEVYEKIYKRPISEPELQERLTQRIHQQASEDIAMRLQDIYFQIYRKIFTLGAHKVFEEVQREDFMRGIEVLKNEIERNLFRINTELKERERKGEKLPKLYHYTEEDDYVHEMDINGIRKMVPRLRPVRILKSISLSDFAVNLISEFSHWQERTGYGHNSNYTYGHPAHEGSFYKQLGQYAEKIKGENIDAFMLLPDAAMVQEAFHLYEKLLEEEYARIDWKLRPNMFLNKLSEFNTRIEQEIINYLKLKYGEDVPETRFQNAIKNAVGFFSRGLFLTESEKNAFADPVDAKGTGMFASYGTNDSSSITAFNPLHVIMRWQGQGNYHQAFFMPISGEAGKFFGGWDHSKIYKNIQIYKDQFLKLEEGVEGTTKNLFVDQILGIAKTGGIFKRAGWRNYYMLESHYVYKGEKEGQKGSELDIIKTYQAMDTIGYEAIKYFLETLGSSFYNKFKLPDQAERDKLYDFLFNRYFKPLGSGGDYKSYRETLKEPAIKELKEHKKDLTEEEIQNEMNNIFTQRVLARIIALRFPTKFLRIDKGRFHAEPGKVGKSRWETVYEIMKSKEGFKDITNEEFDQYMKHLNFFEMMLRSENSENVFEAIQMSREREDFSLGDYNQLMDVLTKEKLIKLMEKNKFRQIKGEKDFEGVKALYDIIRENYLNHEFLDTEAMKAMKKFPFTFGVEDTDMRMIAFRGTGPRMIARSIKDMAVMEENVINGLYELPKILHKMSIDGKNDFTPVIEYLLKARDAFWNVHGPGDEYYEFAYKIAGMVTNYFKKDSAAKPLFGLFRLGRLNSMAAEYAGRSTAVMEWDSRDIDRFAVALESWGILPLKPYDKSVGPVYKDRYINILGKRIKFGRELDPAFKWTASRFRKEFGGDGKAIAFDMFNQFIPLVAMFLLWKYIKDAMDEVTGQKK